MHSKTMGHIFKFILLIAITLVALESCSGTFSEQSDDISDTKHSRRSRTQTLTPEQNEDTNITRENQNVRVTSDDSGKDASNHRNNGRHGNGKRRRKSKRLMKSRRNKSRKPKQHRHDEDVEDDIAENEQKEIMRSTMKYMLGFDHIDKKTNHKTSENFRDRHFDVNAQEGQVESPKPPNFMLELYRSYTEDKSLMMLHSVSQGNTIRSFFPISVDPSEHARDKGKPVTIAPVTNNEDPTPELQKQIPVFLFNLSNIPINENLVGAEVRLDDMTDDRDDDRHSEITSNRAARGNRQDGRDEELDVSDNSNTEKFNMKDKFSEKNSRWFVLAAVYMRSESGCSGNQTCRKIFSMVGSTTKLSPSSGDLWGDKNLFRKAALARQPNHVLVVKFKMEQEGDTDDEILERRTRSVDTSDDEILPNSFVVVGYERPKRDSEMDEILASSVPFRSTASSPTDGDSYRRYSHDDIDVSLVPILIVYCNDTRTAVGSAESSTAPLIWKALGNVTSNLNKRRRRSADDDNELNGQTEKGEEMWQDDSWVPYKVDKANGEKEIIPDSYPSEHTNEIENPIENDMTELHDNSKGNRMLMKSLKDRKSLKKGKKKNRRGKGKKNRGRNGRKHKKRVKAARKGNQVNQDCGRRALVVDFAEIGFSDWIISPSAFDAYYCSGMCEFPRINQMEMAASNHAIIQSLVRLIASKEIPMPCCTPEKMMSLSVLFFDEDHNVVLKVYPGMSVETCACR